MPGQKPNSINIAMRAEIQAQLDVELAKADAEISARTAEAATALAEIRDSSVTALKTWLKRQRKKLLQQWAVRQMLKP